MNFEKSQTILEEIEKSNKILINLHRSPDPDSFSSAFSLYHFLISLNKVVEVCLVSTSELSTYLVSQDDASVVKFVDYQKLNFKDYDLMVSPDSASWQQIVNNKDIDVPDIPIIVIDHHPTNEKFGKINLVENLAASCSEMIYKLFQDWDFVINNKIANLLLTGIIADTGGFNFSDNSETLRIAANLIDLGANKTKIITNIFRNKKFEVLKYWGECFQRLEFDREHKFVWIATPFEIENKYKINNSDFSTMFASIVDGTNFGVVMSEDEPKSLKISLRGRNNFNVSDIAQEFEGGGHRLAAGAKIDGLSFNEAVEKVLEVCRKYASKNI